MTKYLVYIHTNKINGKKYIGMTSKSLQKRICDGYHNDFAEDIERYGWDNFDSIVVKDNLSVEDADILESSLIEKYKTIEYGYNRQLGGIRGKHSEKSKERMSKAAMGRVLSDETKKKISIKGSLRKHSSETKKKISEANKGKIRTEEWLQNMSNSRKGKPISMSFSGHKHSEESKNKISKSLKGRTPWNKGKSYTIKKEGNYEASGSEENM